MNRLLVVDDDAFLRENLKRLLEQYQYEVVSVASGADALRALSETPFQLVILDLGLSDVVWRWLRLPHG
ncbi:MAG: hypothetical protein KatS3mg016_0423 [Fimbriimonadales bacterium]|nr:MAG: hypothetical protein KatS3mg016_0423 [Fimbriimonadales bacterium]